MRKTVNAFKSAFKKKDAAAAAAETAAEIGANALCIVTENFGTLTLTVEQDPRSKILMDLPAGTPLEVDELGEETIEEDGSAKQRCKVNMYDGKTGWLDFKCAPPHGEAKLFLQKNLSAQVSPSGLAEFCKVDTEYFLLVDTPLTETEDSSSTIITEATVGTTCKVLEVSGTNCLRIRIEIAMDEDDDSAWASSKGWINLISSQAELIIGTEVLINEDVSTADSSSKAAAGPRARAAAAARKAKEKAGALKDKAKFRFKGVHMPGKGIKGKMGGRMKSVFGKQNAGSLCIGDVCEAINQLKIYDEDNLKGSAKTEIAKGWGFVILELKDDDPAAKIVRILTYTDVEGWCSVKPTRKGYVGPKKFKIKKSLLASVAPQDVDTALTIGTEYETIMATEVRTTEDPNSNVSSLLQPGVNVKLIKVTGNGKHQAIISSTDAVGFIPLVNEKGEWFIGDPGLKYVEPFLEAARNGDLDKMKELEDKLKAKKVDCTNSTAEGMTALMYASVLGYTNIVAYLLVENKSADVNLTDDEGRTPLHHACTKQQRERRDEDATKILEMLVQSEAQVNAPDNTGKTPLMHAAMSGDDMAISLLIDSKALVSIKDQDELTAIEHAKNANAKTCEAILCSKLSEQEAAGCIEEESPTPAQVVEAAEAAEDVEAAEAVEESPEAEGEEIEEAPFLAADDGSPAPKKKSTAKKKAGAKSTAKKAAKKK